MAIPHSHTLDLADPLTQHPPRVLIIENDFLIAEMIHDMVRDLGYAVTQPAHTLPAALKKIDKNNFDCALVNIGIDAEKHGIEIADILTELGVPFGFITGYSHPLAERHADAPLLQKPFSSAQLQIFLRGLLLGSR
jgi:CheY-like chemotaxis protein